VQKQLRRYGNAVRFLPKERAEHLEYRLTACFGFRVISVLHGYPKTGEKITFDQVKKIANRTNPRFPSGEKVTITAIAKADGGKRPVTKFGRVARANQSMARDLIYMACGHSKFEYARRGRGREKLIEAINHANKNGGVRALGTFDIKDCFLSMGRAAVESVIPISPSIIRNSIFISDDTSIHMYTDLVSEHAVRAGLPQGGLASPIAAGLVIEPCLEKVPARFRGSYLDDISTGDGSVEEVEAGHDILTAAFASQYPGSPLFEKCRAAFKIGKHEDVLGYWPRPNAPEFGGGLRFSPSNKAIRRFYVRLATCLLKRPYHEWGNIMEEKAYAFAASAKNWRGAKGGREFLITVFAMQIELLLKTAHQKVLAAIAAGASSGVVHELAAQMAGELVPATVIVNADGLMDW
jgi:Reverse transcriptase (RNA-dependent DNA polymerase)